MKNLIKYVTFTGFIMSQTIGVAGVRVEPPRVPTRAEYAAAAAKYNVAFAAYSKVGPQGLIDNAPKAFDAKDRQFIMGKLQSENQKFPTLPSMELSKESDAISFRMSANQVLTLKGVDLDKGLFTINGRPFQLNRNASFADNNAVILKIVNSIESESHASIKAGFFDMLSAKFAFAIMPRAEADDYSGAQVSSSNNTWWWVLGIVGALAIGFAAYEIISNNKTDRLAREGVTGHVSYTPSGVVNTTAYGTVYGGSSNTIVTHN